MRLSALLILCLLVQQLYAPLGLASTKGPGQGIPYIEMASEPTENAPELTVKSVTPRNEAELETAVGWAARELHQEEGAKRRIVIASMGDEYHSQLTTTSREILGKLSDLTTTSDELRVVYANVPEDVEEEIGSRSRLKEFFYKHERITLTLVKSAMKGGISGVAMVVAAGLPVSVAVPIALYSAFQSGAFQYFNPHVERFLNGNQERKEELLASGRMGRLRVKTAQLSRSFMIGVFVNTMVTIASTVAGIPAEAPMAEVVNIFKTTLIGTASMGMWNVTVASETRDGIHANEGNPEEQARWQRRSNVIRFSMSMVTSFAGILTLLGVPMGYWMQGILGVTGIMYAGKSWISKKFKAVRSQKLAGGSCRSLFL